jgi:hypothetical protein
LSRLLFRLKIRPGFSFNVIDPKKQ